MESRRGPATAQSTQPFGNIPSPSPREAEHGESIGTGSCLPSIEADEACVVRTTVLAAGNMKQEEKIKTR